MIRDHLACEADFPWIGSDDPVEANPPGRELAHFILAALSPHADHVNEVWNEEGFGWSFNVRYNRVTINVLVAGGNLEDWLISCHIISLLRRYLFPHQYEAALGEVCGRIDQLARSDARFRNIQWFTREEYEARPIRNKRQWIP